MVHFFFQKKKIKYFLQQLIIYLNFPSLYLDKLLFQNSNQPKPSHNPDITITSYSDVSDGTPNKQLLKFPAKIKQEENQVLMKKTSDSIKGLMTPKKNNTLIDWSKYNVNPVNGKNIFPQGAGISIEFSNENSLSFKQQVKAIYNNLPNKFIEKESKPQDFSNLEKITKNMNNQNLQTLNHQMKSFNQKKKLQINQKQKQHKQYHKLKHFNKKQIKYIKFSFLKDSMIEIQESQISNLKNLCKSQQQGQIILSNNKIVDLKNLVRIIQTPFVYIVKLLDVQQIQILSNTNYWNNYILQCKPNYFQLNGDFFFTIILELPNILKRISMFQV